MPLVPVQRASFAGRRWRKSQGFAFAQQIPMVPIALSEALLACSAMPIAFAMREGRYQAMALLSPTSTQNVFVGLDGRWLARYVPAALRGYPFHSMRVEGSADWALAFDDSSGLITSDTDAGTEAFLNADGKPTPALQAVAEFLMARSKGYAAAQAAIDALLQQGLVEPWPIPVAVQPGQAPVTLDGFHRVNMRALETVPDAALLALRSAGALALAYAQAASVPQVGVLGELYSLQARLRSTAGTPQPAPKAGGTGLQGMSVSIEEGQFKFD